MWLAAGGCIPLPGQLAWPMTVLSRPESRHGVLMVDCSLRAADKTRAIFGAARRVPFLESLFHPQVDAMPSSSLTPPVWARLARVRRQLLQTCRKTSTEWKLLREWRRWFNRLAHLPRWVCPCRRPLISLVVDATDVSWTGAQRIWSDRTHDDGKDSFLLMIEHASPCDLLLYAECRQAETHYHRLRQLGDELSAATGHRAEADALKRVYLYLKNAELGGAQRMAELVFETQRRACYRMGPDPAPALLRLATNLDEVRRRPQELWPTHAHIELVGKTLADMALGTTAALNQLLADHPRAQLDRTLAWLGDYRRIKSAEWRRRTDAIVSKHYPWVKPGNAILRPARRHVLRTSWCVIGDLLPPPAGGE